MISIKGEQEKKNTKIKTNSDDAGVGQEKKNRNKKIGWSRNGIGAGGNQREKKNETRSLKMPN